MFYEFDKNDIHKDHAYIFDRRCEYGSDDQFYELNGKEYVAYRDEKDGLRSMFLSDAKFDKKFESPKSLFLRTDPETGDYENYYESELEHEVEVAHSKFHLLKYINENVNKEDPRYESFNFYKVLKYGLFEH